MVTADALATNGGGVLKSLKLVKTTEMVNLGMGARSIFLGLYARFQNSGRIPL